MAYLGICLDVPCPSVYAAVYAGKFKSLPVASGVSVAPPDLGLTTAVSGWVVACPSAYTAVYAGKFKSLSVASGVSVLPPRVVATYTHAVALAPIEVVTYVPQTTYYMRGLDSNPNSFVYWSDLTPNILPSVTTPDLTGTLVNVCVVGTSTTNLSQALEFDPDLADIYNFFKH